jgi:hypothetical protein
VDWDFYSGSGSLDAGPVDVTALSGTQLPTGVWKHLAVTASGTDYQLYIDGFPAAKSTGPAIAPSELEPLDTASTLGKSRFSDPNLTGLMDELRIYSRALSVPEIEALAYPKTDYASWHFDENTGTTALDSSDSLIPTNLVGGAGWTQSGRLGAALDLSGVSTTDDAGTTTGPYVTFGSNPVANCTTSLTVSTWINLRASTPWMRIFDFGTPAVGAGSRFMYLTPSDGAGMHFAMVAPTGVFDLVATGTSVPADSAWHHVAVTVGSGGATIYLDGAVAATGTPAGPTPGDFADPSVTANWLGKSRFPDPYLNASLDELRISCRTYTADEIKSLAYAQ